MLSNSFRIVHIYYSVVQWMEKSKYGMFTTKEPASEHTSATPKPSEIYHSTMMAQDSLVLDMTNLSNNGIQKLEPAFQNTK